MNLRACCIALFCLSLANPATFIWAQDESESASSPTGAEDGASMKFEEATLEVQKAIQSYQSAFNSADDEALAELWSPHGIYRMRSSGEEILGREAIGKLFDSLLENQQTPRRLELATQSIEFISPRVAVEKGVASVSHGDESLRQTAYTAVYVKESGNWLLDLVTEDEILPSNNHYENLQDLDWLIGDWVDTGEGFSIETSFNWTRNQNYISRSYKVTTEEGVEASGLQIIGWDANQQVIRSWLFDSQGGFVEGTWMQRDDHWVVQSVATLSDGGKGSFTSIFTPVDDNSFTWEKINRVVDGQLLPNLDEVTIQRK